MSSIFYDCLTIIGGVTVVCLAGFLVICAWSAIDEGIKDLKRTYRQKHRFDKPPTAKCYCIDCVYHDDESKRCYRFTKEYRNTADNWFCWEASPRKK